MSGRPGEARGGDDLAAQIERLPLARRILLARRLAEAGLDAPGLPVLPIERTPGGFHDLSLAQRGIWLVEQLHPGNAAYNLAVAARIEGLLDRLALQQSFDVLARRHEGLRVELSVRDGRPVQRILAEPGSRLVFADSGSFEEAARRCSEEAQRPFDLTGGPVWRAILFRSSEADHAIVLVIHHLLADNWSMGIFGRELAACYAALAGSRPAEAAFAGGRPAELPELPIQYIDFAAWQRRRLEKGALGGQLQHWRRLLEGAPPAPRLPADHARPRVSSYRGARRHLQLSSGLSASLRAVTVREGVTLFMVLVAALQAVLHRHTGEDRIVVGTDVAGRDRAELEGLVGLFVNQIVLATDLSQNPTLHELLARVRETCLAAYAHQEVPFHDVVLAVNPARSVDRTPLFQVKIELLAVPMEAVSLPGLDVTPILLEGTAKFDLELILWDTPGGLRGFFEYATDLFEASTIDRVMEHFMTFLERLAADPAERVLDVRLAGERRGAAVSFGQADEFSFEP